MYTYTLYLGLQVFDSVSIFEGILRLLKAGAGGADVGDHDSEAVATQSVLQETCQLAVTVIDILASTAEGVDAVGQGQKRAVDVGSFLHPLATILMEREENEQTEERAHS